MGTNTKFSPLNQAEQLKNDGNVFFSKNRFGAAIDAYTEVPYFLFPIALAFIVLYSESSHGLLSIFLPTQQVIFYLHCFFSGMGFLNLLIGLCYIFFS